MLTFLTAICAVNFRHYVEAVKHFQTSDCCQMEKKYVVVVVGCKKLFFSNALLKTVYNLSNLFGIDLMISFFSFLQNPILCHHNGSQFKTFWRISVGTFCNFVYRKSDHFWSLKRIMFYLLIMKACKTNMTSIEIGCSVSPKKF